MYPLEEKIEQQINKLQKPRPTLLFPEATDQRVILAVSKLTNLAKIVLLGTEAEIVDILKNKLEFTERRIDFFLRQVRIINPAKEKQLRTEFANELVAISNGTDWSISPQKAARLVKKNNYFAILATRLGYADAVLGGVALTSNEFFVLCLQILEQDETVFEMALFVLPDEHPAEHFEHNIAIVSDIAVNQVMDAEKLANVAVSTCRLTRDLLPPEDLEHVYGAIVSYSTKGSASGPSVEMVRNAGKKIPALLARLRKENPLYETIKIESELQISCALSQEAAAIQLKEVEKPDSVYGRANVLIAPNLDLGNFLYYTYALRYPNSKKVIISGGLRHQAIELSQTASVEDIRLGAKSLVLYIGKESRFQQTPRDYFFPRYQILTINPGSTSTKIALFHGEVAEFKLSLSHSTEELEPFDRIVDQYEFREAVILSELAHRDISLESIDAFVGRGGLLKPIPGGTYQVNEKMKADLRTGRYSEHASNLGALLADGLGHRVGKPSFIVDPVVVDELAAKARITGFKDISRKSLWHALNQRRVAQNYANSVHKFYDEVNVIVAHLGGGITVGAHYRGRTVDVNDGLHGDGPFSPERSGMLPAERLMDIINGNEYTTKELRQRIHGKGGLVDLLQTNDVREAARRMDAGDDYARLVIDAMFYNVAKQITSLIPAFDGEKVDAVILTGGIAFWDYCISSLKKYLKPLELEILVMPGEKELEALRDGAVKVLRGESAVLKYQ